MIRLPRPRRFSDITEDRPPTKRRTRDRNARFDHMLQSIMPKDTRQPEAYKLTTSELSFIKIKKTDTRRSSSASKVFP